VPFENERLNAGELTHEPESENLLWKFLEMMVLQEVTGSSRYDKNIILDITIILNLKFVKSCP